MTGNEMLQALTDLERRIRDLENGAGAIEPPDLQDVVTDIVPSQDRAASLGRDYQTFYDGHMARVFTQQIGSPQHSGLPLRFAYGTRIDWSDTTHLNAPWEAESPAYTLGTIDIGPVVSLVGKTLEQVAGTLADFEEKLDSIHATLDGTMPNPADPS